VEGVTLRPIFEGEQSRNNQDGIGMESRTLHGDALVQLRLLVFREVAAARYKRCWKVKVVAYKCSLEMCYWFHFILYTIMVRAWRCTLNAAGVESDEVGGTLTTDNPKL
jgi:hypothetical protein